MIRNNTNISVGMLANPSNFRVVTNTQVRERQILYRQVRTRPSEGLGIAARGVSERESEYLLLLVLGLRARRRVGAAHVEAGVELALVRGLEDLEGAHERLVDGHERARVVELAAVVGRREQCHQLALREELVAVLHHLYNKYVIY